MNISYTCVGKYKGHFFKIVSARVNHTANCEYGAVVEVNGIKRHARIGTQKNIFDNVDDAIKAAKRFIDSSLTMKVVSCS